MDALVLDTHQHRPPGMVPADGQLQRGLQDHIADDRPDLVAVGLDLSDARPVVVCRVEIVPAHLVHPDRKHGFKAGMDALTDQPGQQQLVDEEGRGMTEVKDQWMA